MATVLHDAIMNPAEGKSSPQDVLLPSGHLVALWAQLETMTSVLVFVPLFAFQW